jgi:precorrin-3B methylase
MLSLSGRRVCILAGGDPSLFSSSWRISEGRRICPGISAFSAISAKAGAPIANDFIIISGADRKSLAALPSLIEADYTVVIYNLAMDAISDIMGHVPPKRPTALGMDLTRNEEQFFIGTALEIAEDCARLKGNRWTLLVSASRADLTKGVIIGKRGYESRYDF